MKKLLNYKIKIDWKKSLTEYYILSFDVKDNNNLRHIISLIFLNLALQNLKLTLTRYEAIKNKKAISEAI